MTYGVQVPLDFTRLVRATDPDTSLFAAIKAAKASVLAVEAVAALMEDGIPRIDEIIHRDLRGLIRFYRSFDVTRHARKALEDAGYIRDTGTRLLTDSGCPSREWVWVTDGG